MAKKPKPQAPSAAPEPVAYSVLSLPVDRIVPSALNRRLDDGDESIRLLSVSMEEQGLVSPIKVRELPAGAGWEIVYGERRWRAAKRLGWETIPAIVCASSKEEAHAERLVENLQRVDVPPLEQSEGVAWLLARHKGGAAEVAKRLGVSESWVYLRARLSQLSPAWREELSHPDTGYESIRDRVTLQERIARLPMETQDLLLRTNRLLYAETLDGLEGEIGQLLHKVASAPWPAAYERKRERPCESCAHRSDAAGNVPLFPELSKGGAEECYCLAPECWEAKVRGWVLSVARTARKRNGRCVLLQDAWTASKASVDEFEVVGARQSWSVRLEEPRAEEAGEYDRVLGVWLDGEKVGTTQECWLRHEEEEEEDEAPETGEDASGLAEVKKTERRAKRAAQALLSLALVEGGIPRLPQPSEADLLRVAAWAFCGDTDGEEAAAATEDAAAESLWLAACSALDDAAWSLEREGIEEICAVARLFGGADLEQAVEAAYTAEPDGENN